MVGQGMELGLSIRGGTEHELGIYVTAVDPGSVAHAYGIKVRRGGCQYVVGMQICVCVDVLGMLEYSVVKLSFFMLKRVW